MRQSSRSYLQEILVHIMCLKITIAQVFQNQKQEITFQYLLLCDKMPKSLYKPNNILTHL